jgi:cytochrome c peroxidase
LYNFSLFFGLAVQAHEATLVSDDTPFDRFLRDPVNAPLSPRGRAWTSGLLQELQDRPDLTDAQKRGVLAENARQLYRLR